MKPVIAAVFLAVLASHPTGAFGQVPSDSQALKAEVLKAEEAFNQAKIHNDVGALDRIIADDYLGINQWGARRDKKSVIELFRTFPTSSLTPTHVRVRVSGDVAIVDGAMNESGQMTFLFLRTYVKRQGRWQLLTSVQSFPLDTDMKPSDPIALMQNQ